MQTIQDIALDPHSREELLPGYAPDFPYISSRALLGQYRQPFVPWHWHNAVELFYIESGCVEYTTPHGVFRFPKGSGGFVNSNVLHSSRDAGDGEEAVELLHLFDPALLSGTPDSRIARRYIQPLTANHALELLPLLPGRQDALLEKLRCSLALDPAENGYELRLRSKLSEIWLELLAIAGPGDGSPVSDTDSAMKRMMVYLYEHYPESVSIQALAQAGGVSKRECFRLFRQQLRTTPTDYLRQFRLQKACALLSDSALPITEIAYRCGLGSSSYFGKTFRESFGCTPRDYRARWHDCDSSGQK